VPCFRAAGLVWWLLSEARNGDGWPCASAVGPALSRLRKGHGWGARGQTSADGPELQHKVKELERAIEDVRPPARRPQPRELRELAKSRAGESLGAYPPSLRGP